MAKREERYTVDREACNGEVGLVLSWKREDGKKQPIECWYNSFRDAELDLLVITKSTKTLPGLFISYDINYKKKGQH